MAKTSTRKTETVKETVEATNFMNEPVDESAVKKETAKVAKSYSDTDFVRCKSITQGKMILGGKKSGAIYVWYAYGDEIDIQYNDLKTMLLSRDRSLMMPRFIVEDEELLETKEWRHVKELYDSMYDATDISNVLSLPLADFRHVLETAPVGLRNAIKIEVSDRYADGTFDSINKIKAVEEICDVEILNLA